MIHWGLTILYFSLFLFFILRFKFFRPEGISPTLIAVAFLFKTAAGILLGYIYAYHYKGEGDTFKYFWDGNTLHQVMISHPVDYLRILTGVVSDHNDFHQKYYRFLYNWYNNDFDTFFNDSRTIICINSLLRIFSFGEYNVHVVFFSFFSFAGLTALFHFFSAAITAHHKIFYSGIFLLPSVAFWGSGVMKEAIVIFSFGFVLYFTLSYFKNKAIKNVFLLVLFSVLLVFVKFYYLILLLPGIAGWIWSWNSSSVYFKYFVSHLVLFILLFSLKFIFPAYDIPTALSNKQNNFINFAHKTHAGSLHYEEKLLPRWNDVLKKSPQAFLISVSTPLAFSSGNILLVASSAETIFILLIIIAAIILFRKPAQDDLPMLLLCLSFVLLSFTLIGLTTPVAGAIVRYKIITLPFLIFLAFYFITHSKVVSGRDS